MEGGEAGVVAVTKVFAIRVRLDDRVRYITDGEKTSLASSITYISNPEKTEQFFFTSALNCSSVDTALSEMMETKQQFGKMGGVLGYHFIQSFQPGEVTPEQAHAIGLEFAKRLFGKRYEVVISTHLNKHHLHNHLVVNSVSCVDGQKYHSSPESYYNDVRGTSDALCRENDLSVITPQGKGKHYAEWKAEQGGKPTMRGVIRADIDAIIGQAYTYDTFLMLLRRNGYEVRRSPNRKYTTVKPPGAKRAIRLDSLGEGYTEADILLRLSRQRHGGMAPPTVTHAVKRYRIKGKLSTVRKKKITGFHALYLRYLYLLRGGRRKKLPPKLPFSVKREVIHLERYEQQFKYLLSSGITTEAELEQRIRVLEWDIRLLEEQRKPLYQERRNTSDEETQAKYSAEIQQQTAALREKRREVRLCRRIQADIPRVSQQCQQAQAERQENLKTRRNTSMSTNGETADLMVREGIQITESALKLAGLGAKNLAALLIALANDNQKLAGKTNLKRLIHDGEELTIFSVKQEDLKGFQMEAKRYGVLFYPIVNKVEKTGTVEIMAKAKDAKQINRIFERMGYPAPVKEDTAAKKENARAPSENSSKERGTGARASTEPATEKADARPSVRSRLMALQAAAERDGTAPTKDTVREAIQKAMPTRE